MTDENKEQAEEMIPVSQLQEYIKEAAKEMWRDEAAARKAEAEAKKAVIKEKYQEYSTLQKEGEEPWIAVVGESMDEHGQVSFEMDWNDAMIQYLRDEGVPGITDDEVINTYLAALFKHVVGDDITENDLNIDKEEM